MSMLNDVHEDRMAQAWHDMAFHNLPGRHQAAGPLGENRFH